MGNGLTVPISDGPRESNLRTEEAGLPETTLHKCEERTPIPIDVRIGRRGRRKERGKAPAGEGELPRGGHGEAPALGMAIDRDEARWGRDRPHFRGVEFPVELDTADEGRVVTDSKRVTFAHGEAGAGGDPHVDGASGIPPSGGANEATTEELGNLEDRRGGSVLIDVTTEEPSGVGAQDLHEGVLQKTGCFDMLPRGGVHVSQHTRTERNDNALNTMGVRGEDTPRTERSTGDGGDTSPMA